MHFVISVFIAVCLIAIVVLFAELFPKWVQYAFIAVSCVISGYALAILVRKIAEEFAWYAKPDLMPAFYTGTGVAFVVAIIIMVIINKKAKKAS